MSRVAACVFNRTRRAGLSRVGRESWWRTWMVPRHCGVQECRDLFVVEDALLAFVDARSFVLFEAAEWIVGEVAAAEGVGEDAAERDERVVDRFRCELLGTH